MICRGVQPSHIILHPAPIPLPIEAAKKIANHHYKNKDRPKAATTTNNNKQKGTVRIVFTIATPAAAPTPSPRWIVSNPQYHRQYRKNIQSTIQKTTTAAAALLLPLLHRFTAPYHPSRIFLFLFGLSYHRWGRWIFLP